MLFRGSNHGWIVSIEGPHDEIYLRNPLTGAKIQLPSRSKFPDVIEYCADNCGDEYNLWSASTNPSVTDEFVVVAIYGECDRLAYCRNKDEKWCSFSGNRRIYEDATFYKGKLYAIACDGSLKDTKAEFLHKTATFKVFKLDMSCFKWSRVTDIRDDVLFVGSNTSVSRSSVEFPELKSNSIYFTDTLFGSHYEGIRGGTEIGVFAISSESMVELPGYKCETDLIWPSPIWFIPTLQ